MAKLIYWLCLFAVAAPLAGQTPAAMPPGTGAHTPKPRNGYLRFLNMSPLDSGVLELLASTTPPDGRALMVAPPSNFGADYVALPPVRLILRVARANNRQVSLKALDVPLRVDAYFTILAYVQADGQPAVDLIDDTPNLDLPPSNQLAVRQFCRNVRVTITTASRAQTNALNYAEMQTLGNLPEGAGPLSVQAIRLPGPPVTSKLDVDFHACRRHTVLFASDPYNRIRSRVVDDGPSRVDEDAARAAANAAASPTP